MTQEFKGPIHDGQFAGGNIINNNLLTDDELKNLKSPELKQRLKINRKRVSKARQHKYFNIWNGLFVLGLIYPIFMHGMPIFKYISHNTTNIWTFSQSFNNAINYIQAVSINSPIFTTGYVILMILFMVLSARKNQAESRYIRKVKKEIIKIEDELRNRRV